MNGDVVVGSQFNRWTVLVVLGRRVICRCECGTERYVLRWDIVNGKSKSCGCWRNEVSKTLHRTHGHAADGDHTPEYQSWRAMRERCFNPNADNYQHYGGKGIRVCDRWASFDNFLGDMGSKPSPRHSVERIDGSLGYTPENCRWAAAAEQQNNRCNNHRLEFGGRVQTIAQWARETGISDHTLRARLTRGWSIERTLTAPVDARTWDVRRAAPEVR